jgi:pimeloyl-ACP methyl ester carboxylesterase
MIYTQIFSSQCIRSNIKATFAQAKENTLESKRKIKLAEVRGYTRLVKEATLGVTEIVQAMHHRIVHPPFLPSTPIQHIITGIADITYFNIKTATNWIGGALDKTMGLFPSSHGGDISPGKRKDFVAVLNGIIGDHMTRTNNPLVLSMQLNYKGHKIDPESTAFQEALSRSKGKIMIMVHGLCGHDNRWEENGINPSENLAKALNYTPLYLQYNSGLHISDNGQQMNAILNELIHKFSNAINDIVLIGHSMGGLVIRSSCHYDMEENDRWTKLVSKIITLGTPHHGASLEKLGNYVDNILEVIPYTKPLARLGKIRSTGITDLRFGSVIDDAQGQDRFELSEDNRIQVPLPEGIECFAIAATKNPTEKEKFSKLSGDGLVSVNSAIGIHKDEKRNLNFPESNIHLCYDTKHTQLLTDEKIFIKIHEWISPSN